MRYIEDDHCEKSPEVAEFLAYLPFPFFCRKMCLAKEIPRLQIVKASHLEDSTACSCHIHIVIIIAVVRMGQIEALLLEETKPAETLK